MRQNRIFSIFRQELRLRAGNVIIADSSGDGTDFVGEGSEISKFKRIPQIPLIVTENTRNKVLFSHETFPRKLNAFLSGFMLSQISKTKESLSIEIDQSFDLSRQNIANFYQT